MKLPPLLTAGALYAAIGLAAGTISGLFGVGGGILMVPAAVMLLKADIHTAVGTSLAVIVPTALVGTIRHHQFGHVDFSMAIGLAVGALVGAYLIGAPLAKATEPDKLKLMFGILMIIVGLRMTGAFSAVASLFAR